MGFQRFGKKQDFIIYLKYKITFKQVVFMSG
jgi:hypothetical protein